MRTVVVAILYMLSCNAWANVKTVSGIDYPSYALPANDKENGKIEVRCSEIKGSSNNIACAFDQTVIQHLDTKDAESKIQMIKDKSNKKIEDEIKGYSLNKSNNNLDKAFSESYSQARSDDERKTIIDFFIL